MTKTQLNYFFNQKYGARVPGRAIRYDFLFFFFSRLKASVFVKSIETCVTCVFKELRTFAPKSSYGEIFFISPLELVDKVLTPKMKKEMGVTDFVSEKMAVEKCLNFDKSVIITRCSLLC